MICFVSCSLNVFAGDNNGVWEEVSKKGLAAVLHSYNEITGDTELINEYGYIHKTKFMKLTEPDQEYIKRQKILIEKKATYFPQREWELSDGSKITGAINSFANTENDLLVLYTENENLKALRVEQSEEYLKWIGDHLKDVLYTAKLERFSGEGYFENFKPVPILKREECPILEDKYFNSKTYGNLGIALGHSLQWWDTIGYLPIPKRGSSERKMKWTLKLIERATGNNTPNTDNAVKIIKQHFTENLGAVASCKVRKVREISPVILKHFTNNEMAVLIRIRYKNKSGDSYSRWAALTDVNENGDIVMKAWGVKLFAKIEHVANQPFLYTVDIKNRIDLPTKVQKQEYLFSFDHSHPLSGMIVLRPYVFKKDKVTTVPFDPYLELPIKSIR